jgi:hypothetical protein
VAAATNYVLHNGNHTGSVVPEAATVVEAACGMPLPIVFLFEFQATAFIGSGKPQDATATVAACGAMLPVW